MFFVNEISGKLQRRLMNEISGNLQHPLMLLLYKVTVRKKELRLKFLSHVYCSVTISAVEENHITKTQRRYVSDMRVK